MSGCLQIIADMVDGGDGDEKTALDEKPAAAEGVEDTEGDDEVCPPCPAAALPTPLRPSSD